MNISKGKLLVWAGNALMTLAFVGAVGLVWDQELQPLWLQYREQASYFAVTPTVTYTPTITPQPTITPTPLPSTTPLPSPTATFTPTPTHIPREDYLLKVPSINLKWVVHHITQEEENYEPWGIPKKILDKYGVVDYPHLSFPGEKGIVGIAGHRDISGNPFWNLDKIKIGDKIILVRKDGSEITYIVYNVLTVVPDDPIFWTNENPNEIRLVSCLIGSTKKRVIIFGYQQGD